MLLRTVGAAVPPIDGLTVTEVADVCGRVPKTVRGWCRTRKLRHRFDQRLVDVLGVNRSWVNIVRNKSTATTQLRGD